MILAVLTLATLAAAQPHGYQYQLGSHHHPPHHDTRCADPGYPCCSPATWIPVPATQGVQLTPGQISEHGALDEVPSEVYLTGESPIPLHEQPHGQCPGKQHRVRRAKTKPVQGG